MQKVVPNEELSIVLRWQINFGRQKSGAIKHKTGGHLCQSAIECLALCVRTNPPIEYLTTMSLSQQRRRTDILCCNIWLLGGRNIVEILKEFSRVVLLNNRSPCFYYNQQMHN